MADIDRIMGHKVEEDAFIVWNGSILVVVDPSEFPKMKKIIERFGKHNFSDSSDGSFAAQIAHAAHGDNTFDAQFDVDALEEYLTLVERDDFDDEMNEKFFEEHDIS